MTMSFNELKRSSSTSFDKLNQELTKINTPQNQDRSNDTRMWKPTVDKAGNGYAVIRFLPAPANEDVPFVRVWSHGFQGPGGWYIENSLSTLGTDVKDPVGELNRQLWNSGVESNKEIVRKQKRQLNYYSNIYVVSDPSNPENEGKVFLFRYGKKIFDQLNDLMNPQFPGETPTNPFDLWSGANFKLKIRKVEGYTNYDKSEFEAAAPLAADDELEAIWKAEYPLNDFLDAKNFKSYDELKARLDRVLGGQAEAPRKAATIDTGKAPWEDDEPTAPQPSFKTKAAPKAPAAAAVEEDDEDFAFFKKIAEED